MAIKNLVEDIVFSTIDEIVKQEKHFHEALNNKQDIAAYVLNRIPPKYVTSERGILHGKLEARLLFQQRTDIIFLIHEALEVIKTRRDNPTPSMHGISGTRNHFFPHLIGEVLEETTFSAIPNVEVVLLHKGVPALMADSSWANPYVTNKGTSGYYHFWPDFTDQILPLTDEVPFTLSFSHPRFHKKEMSVSLPVLTEIYITQSKAAQIALLQLKEGEDISFLYE